MSDTKNQTTKPKKNSNNKRKKNTPKRAYTTQQLKKQRMLAAFRECEDILHAAEMAGIHRGTHYDWMKADPKYAEQVEEIEDGINRKKKDLMLNSYALNGNISASAQVAGIHRSTHYAWMENDPEYAKAFEEAGKEAIERLEEEARRRAVDGVDEPVFYQGMECGRVRKYSDILLMFLLKGKQPDTYRENVNHTGEMDVVVSGLAETVLQARKRAERMALQKEAEKIGQGNEAETE